ncbi:MAG TPA: AMP-binding protein [Casimicrobiaceae bacterium]|nr:AMP-binding protein [Casimicrobiaceae bacterium]
MTMQTAVRSTATGHVDTFANDHLPPRDQWPEFLFELPELRYPPRMNCAGVLLDDALARGWGERTAIVAAGGVRWTYRELAERANRIARVLVEDMALVPGNRVLLRGPNSPAMAACWFAIVKAGGIAVATMPMLRAKELTDIVTKARVTHALCDARLVEELERARPQCPTLASVALFQSDAPDGVEARARRKPALFANCDTAADDTAMIAFTSGTTGQPKGTMHFHRDVVAAADCFPKSTLGATADDLFTGSPPLAFTFGLGGLLLFPLRIGAATLLVERPSPDALLAAIAEHRPTVLFTAPTSYRQMAGQVRQFDLSSLRKCVSAGEALPAATRKLWKDTTGLEIIDGIGSTEMLHIFISHPDTDARPGATGKAIPGYVACVLDEHGRPAPPGQSGRLAVKGPTGCRYLDDPRQANYVKDGWNVTGDAYRMDADGWFFYEARTDDMIVSAGYNIAGPEVEGALLQHPAVAECACVASPDDERGAIVKAFVVAKPGVVPGDALTRELQAFVKEAIAPYKYPRAVEYVESLPRTETGKLQRFRLRQREEQRAQERARGGP